MAHKKSIMNKLDKMKTRISLIVALLVLVGAPLCYILLIRYHTKDAMLYTIPSLWGVIIVSAVMAIIAFISLSALLTKRAEQAAEAPSYDETYTEENSEGTVFTDSVNEPDDNLRQTYPELFSEAEEEVVTEARNFDIGAIIKGDGAAVTEDAPTAEEGEEDGLDAWEEFVGKKDETKSDTQLLYENLDAEIPDDYTVTEDETAEIKIEKKKIASLSKGATGIILAFALAIAFTTAVLASFFYITESDDGITSHTLFKKTDYTWKDAASFTVFTMWNDDINIKITTKDGNQLELLSPSLYESKAFAKENESRLIWASKIVSKLVHNGAEKTVEDKESIIAVYDMGDSVPDYIENIIK